MHNVFERIRAWAEARNFITGSNAKAQMVKLIEEVGELAHGLSRNNDDLTRDAIGDCAVVLTIIAAQLGWDIEDCIDSSWEQIKDRKGRMVDGVFVKEEE